MPEPESTGGRNEFGDPDGTMYAGGTPLFDERTGRTISREEYVRNRPRPVSGPPDRLTVRRAVGVVHVFTFKDGVLSTLAHDLRLRFDRIEATLTGPALRATFELSSLVVEGPVENGVVRPERYGPSERQKIAAAIRGEVLDTDRFPTASFEGRVQPDAGGLHVDGELTLRGVARPLSFRALGQGLRHQASFELRPSAWGIAPYKALLGAIRLEDRVRIELDLLEAS